MPQTEAPSEMPQTRSSISTHQLAKLEYRNIGPHRGGRVVAVVGHPRDPMTFYFGACAGGVWKTTDGGNLWENISDGYFKTAAVGALAISDSDPNILYAGMGETTIRSDVSHGDGVYKSTDGGKTWSNMGLRETRHIAKVRIHPQNPDLVYVAAFGHAWGQNDERGLFRSRDGGSSWENILFRSNAAGAIDLTMDPTNPRILYCAFWEAQRTPYGLSSGGPGSSLYKSMDGGETWTDITRSEGLPRGTLGKIGLAISPARPERVWALVEADDGALFRSDDGGDTWQQVSENPELRRRAWYYMHIFADPQNPDVVWVLNLQCWKSTDGGVTFSGVPTPHGDNHDLWIDPMNSRRLIEGNDGGACVSYNGGDSWSTILNQPTAQFYHVTTDTNIPYRVYGSQQDNTAISLPSRSARGVITETEWFEPGGGESGYIAVRPDNPNIQYAGDHRGLITRHDRRTDQQRIIDVWPELYGMYEGAESLKYRFQWTFPLFVSSFDPTVLYAAANCLFRSTDEGSTWKAISPDLTRNDPRTLVPSGGPITRDNTSAEVYATIFSAVESPHEQGTFWIGTDDGLVHISRDDGQTWENITPPDLASPSGEWALISIIDVSVHDTGKAYLAATRYKLDDLHPYLYRTNDYGKTWTNITNGLPDDDFTRVIREDPQCRGLLYAGTETGIYVSFDDGTQWEPLQTNLPVCPIHDLVLHDNDLVVATHGRAFWILDDVTPLHQLSGDRQSRNRLFMPRDTIRFKVYEGFGGGEGTQVCYRMAGPLTYAFTQKERPDGTKEVKLLNAGQNPPDGVIVTYFLAEKPQGEITLTIVNEQGNDIRRFSSKKRNTSEQQESSHEASVSYGMAQPEAGEGSQVAMDPAADTEEQRPFLSTEPGINRFTWNFQYENATRIPDDKFSDFATSGPPVPPGSYHVRLEIDGETFTESFRILKDPRVEATQDDLEAQFELAMKIRNTISLVHEAVLQIRDLREQLDAWEKRLARRTDSVDLRSMARTLIDNLTSIEEEFRNTKATGRNLYPPPNVPTRLNQKLAMLGAVVRSADAAPTAQASEVFSVLSSQVETELTRLANLVQKDIPAFNESLSALGVPAVLPRTIPNPAITM